MRDELLSLDATMANYQDLNDLLESLVDGSDESNDLVSSFTNK
jgi:predicted component of type VI protein secretion system